jgi:hypothetical protein
MNNKLSIVIVAVLLVNIVIMIAGFSFLQQEINVLKPQTPSPSPSPTPYVAPSVSPQPTQTVPSGETPSAKPHMSVVYEWRLKPEYVNNVTWLNWSMAGATQGDQIISTSYVSDNSWTENYIAYISNIWEIPQQVADSHLSGLVGASFIMHVPVKVTFDEATGLTRVVYDYVESGGVPVRYVIESILPVIAVDGQWSKTVI